MNSSTITSAAYRVLHIYELAQLITRFTYRRDSPYSPAQDCLTLLALATVNRFLSVISLAELWSVLSSAVPLTSLLPAGLDGFVTSAMAAKRILKELGIRAATLKDFERYQAYCSLVRRINISKDNALTCRALELADWWLRALDVDIENGHFARLQHIALCPSKFDNWSRYLGRRLGPNVSSATIDFDPTMQYLWASPETGDGFGGVVVLKIWNATRQLLQSGLGHTLQSCSRLTTLAIQVEADAIPLLLRTIKATPMLSNLHLTVSGVVPTMIEPINPQSQDRRLMKLHWVGRWSSLPLVLRVANAWNILFTEIQCASKSCMPGSRMDELLGWISINHPAVTVLFLTEKPKPLQELIDNELRARRDLRVTHAFPSNTLVKLQALRNLRDLRILPFGPVVVTPQVLDVIAANLKFLEICSFSPFRVINDAGAVEWPVTLVQATKFALALPRLWHLGLCFDARRVTNTLENSESRPLPCSQRRLHLAVGCSAIENHDTVTSHLRDTFESVHIMGYRFTDCHASLVGTSEEVGLWARVASALFVPDNDTSIMPNRSNA